MQARAIGKNLRISTKHALILTKRIRNKPLSRAKNFLRNLILKKESIDGKYYTNAAKTILSVLESAEANAKRKNMNVEKLFLEVAKADKGSKFIRPKTRAKFAGRKAKSTNITIILSEK